MMDDGPDEAGHDADCSETTRQVLPGDRHRRPPRIYETINELEPSPAKVIQLVDHDERFRRLLIPALLFFVGQVGLSTTLLRRGP